MRKGQILCFVISIAIGAMILVSCSLRWLGKPSWEPPKVVAVEGAEGWAIWRQASLGLFYRPVRQGQPTPLLLRDGDIVLPVESAPFLYLAGDGPSLSIKSDKHRTELNGKTVALLPDKEAWHWLEKATPEDLSALRLLAIGEEIDARRLESLKRLSQVNPHVGLVVIDSPAALQKILHMFDPNFLFLEGFRLERDDQRIIEKKSGIRTLSLSGEIADLSLLSKLPNLHTLFMDKWDPSISGPFPENLHSLRCLILTDPKVKNLALLGKQRHLAELRFQGDCPLESLDGISKFAELKELALHSCVNVKDLSPLRKLKDLKWLGLPSTTSQEQLESIVRDHPNLVGLELSNTYKVTDLRVLDDLKSLKYLHVFAPEAKLDPLFTMKRLRWLAVGTKKEDVAILVRIQQALPETAVVRVNPVCLGSGWILLLAPGVVLSRWVQKHRRKAAQGRCYR